MIFRCKMVHFWTKTFVTVNGVTLSEVLCHDISTHRVTHLLANLSWVDLDVGCSILCLVMPGLMGNWQNWLSSWAR